VIPSIKILISVATIPKMIQDKETGYSLKSSMLIEKKHGKVP
jgi:hypothetical protein